MSGNTNLNNNAVGRRRGQLPPNLADALFWLDGTISSNEFVDKSGNGRNFTITNNDIEVSKGYPYKSAATISAPVADATLIAADVNEFLYTSGTPNEIPIVSFLQNIDYEDIGFSRHLAQQLDGNGVETYEPRMIDFVWYDLAQTGDDLTNAQNYFNVPTRDADSEWTAKDGNDTTGNGDEATPYLTLSRSNVFIGVGKTIYGKSGLYNENLAQASLYLTKNMVLKGLGFISITSDSAGRVIYSNSGALPQTFKNLIVDGELNAGVGIELNNPSSNKTIDKVLVKRTTGTAINTEVNGDLVDITNCVFTDQEIQLIVRGVTNVLTNLFVGTGQIGCNFAPSAGTNTGIINNNIFRFVSTIADLYITATSTATVKGNKWYPVNSKASILIPNLAITVDLDFSYNLIEGYTSVAPITIDDTPVVDDAIISYNTLNMSASHTVGFIDIVNQLAPLIEENTFNYLGSSAINLMLISSDGGTADNPIVRNNLLNHDLTTGHMILIGSEGVGAWTGNIDNSIIEKNIIYSSYYNSGDLSANCHEIMINDQPTFNGRYNNIKGGGIGLITKGESIVTEGVFQYNILENCRRPIFLNGIQGVKVYNNTIINKTASSSEGITFQINGTTGATNGDVKNNIIILTSNVMINVDTDSISGFDSDYNLFYVIGGGTPSFRIGGVSKTFAEWQGLGYDLNSKVLTTEEYEALFTDVDNDDFSINVDPYPALDLGNDYKTGLDASTDWGNETTIPIVVTKDQGTIKTHGAYIV